MTTFKSELSHFCQVENKVENILARRPLLFTLVLGCNIQLYAVYSIWTVLNIMLGCNIQLYTIYSIWTVPNLKVGCNIQLYGVHCTIAGPNRELYPQLQNSSQM